MLETLTGVFSTEKLVMFLIITRGAYLIDQQYQEYKNTSVFNIPVVFIDQLRICNIIGKMTG